MSRKPAAASPALARSLAAVSRALEGLAVGDALGADFEFRREVCGDDLQQAAASATLSVTDDTQMTLFLAEALLGAPARRVQSAIEIALLRWYRGQIGLAPQQRRGLTRFAVLTQRRAPAMTCMASLHHRHLGRRRPANASRGTGSLMRCMPLLLLHEPTFCAQPAMSLVASVARITHDHPLAAEADCFYTALVHALAQANAGREGAASEIVPSPAEALPRMARRVAGELLAAKVISPELRQWIEHGLSIDEPRRLGGGWVAEEALAIALSAARQARGDFMRGMAIAVCHPGDSDTTAALAGALLAVQGACPEASLVARLDALPAIRYVQQLLALWPARPSRRSESA
ncbi:hypothetical protein GH865_11855 [Rhodocyclus tenuis]|uniref:ADP-ribosylglycohydrolase family protein n=1 Tax=Rhodocyclus gracilis TaxID=2929842 RepID=UPI001298BF3D|nr:ADP-ribosylglycohydrolase family protein [Rhodocyclus gracilis]MRD73935.1 hypothetical protein [Rhodocyclus gracilis]